MNRHTDIQSPPHHTRLAPLPPVAWAKFNKEAPKEIKIDYKGAASPLPKADRVIITWTAAEWSALDHVFLNSNTERYHSSRDFEKNWYRWSHQAPASTFSPLWGYYQLVEVPGENKTHTVLLLKSDAHLAHPPWIDGLAAMVSQVIEEAQPEIIYSIGTAGAASVQEKLGDAAITNSGHIELKKPENIKVKYNESTITGDWFPNLSLLPEVEKSLLFPLSDVVTKTQLNYLIYQLHQKNPDSVKYGFDDLVNAAIMPSNLHTPKGLNKKDIPLLTTDFYYIEEQDDSKDYCALEMDDTVVGYVAKQKDTNFAFIRNISDTVVPEKDQNDKPISQTIRDDWSGLIYENFGLYSSMNGALITWATIAAD